MTGAAAYLRKTVVVLYLVALHALVIYLLSERLLDKYPAPAEAELTVGSVADISIANLPDDNIAPAPAPSASVSPFPSTTFSPETHLRPGGLIVPVAGVKSTQLVDSYSDARSDGRVHDAIDIPAAAGTPVIATANGEIVKFFESKAGGVTIYQSSSDKRFMYYYAHLQARAADLKEGDLVKQGRIIGYVGDTGNAGAGNYHLHFSVASVIDPKRYWEGTYLNPFILLR